MSEKKRMVKIQRNGQWCVFDKFEHALEDVQLHYSEGSDGDSFTWTNVDMTQEEFDALPIFTGW